MPGRGQLRITATRARKRRIETRSRDREGAVTAPKRSTAPGPKVVTERAVKPSSRQAVKPSSREAAKDRNAGLRFAPPWAQKPHPASPERARQQAPLLSEQRHPRRAFNRTRNKRYPSQQELSAEWLSQQYWG